MKDAERLEVPRGRKRGMPPPRGLGSVLHPSRGRREASFLHVSFPGGVGLRDASRTLSHSLNLRHLQAGEPPASKLTAAKEGGYSFWKLRLHVLPERCDMTGGASIYTALLYKHLRAVPELHFCPEGAPGCGHSSQTQGFPGGSGKGSSHPKGRFSRGFSTKG